MTPPQDIIDISYDYDSDQWILIVFVNESIRYVRGYENSHLAQSGKKLLLKKLSSIKDGDVHKCLIEFGMEKKWVYEK